jgi:outer membrane protein OmpA-like peptidoglycan-associated protein
MHQVTGAHRTGANKPKTVYQKKERGKKMNSRLMIANIALVCGLMVVGTGCESWWGGEETPGTTGTEEVPNIIDETGKNVTGTRFEDTCKKVDGVTMAPVYFAFDSYALAPSETAKIEQVAKHLLANESHVLVVEGHCDARGSAEYNLALGENRAQAIRGHMVNLGVAGDRIQTRSFGSEKPAMAGSGEDVWRLNRRGEFALYQK